MPYITGIIVFAVGLTIAGLAPSMPILVAGRALQGLGAGAVPSVAYVAIGRTLPDRLRARMMAILSTAWVAPGLAGPAVSAEIARLFGWRWVFLGLLPFIAVTGPFAVPALVRLGRPVVPGAGRSPAQRRDRRRRRRRACAWRPDTGGRLERRAASQAGAGRESGGAGWCGGGAAAAAGLSSRGLPIGVGDRPESRPDS